MFDNLKVMEVPKRKKAVGFLKSRKSHDKIHSYCYETYQYGLTKGFCIHEFLVDESAGVDIDRGEIDRLIHMLEQGNYVCVVVAAVSDFTKDDDDLQQFLHHIKHTGCSVYSIQEERFIITPQTTGKKR